MDSFAGNLHDPLSLNLYTYCGNNPIRYIDPSGHKKGDKFKTMDEAKDFAINYNPKSIENNVEYATTIYKVKEKITTTKYVKLNILDVLGFSSKLFPASNSLVYTFNIKETKKVTMYTYTKVKKEMNIVRIHHWLHYFIVNQLQHILMVHMTLIIEVMSFQRLI